jgi:zinc transporter ZupT
LTSAPQPLGAVIAYVAVEHVTGLLPFSFSFAAGAMLVLIAVELAPQAYATGGRMAATAGALAGVALMLLLAATLGVD